MRNLLRVRIELHPLCIKFGGREEYPHGQMGVEVIPEKIWNQASGQTFEEKSVEAKRLYQASAQVAREGLRLIGFTESFVGQNFNGQPQTKTWKEGGRHVMWVPQNLVRPIIEAQTQELMAA